MEKYFVKTYKENKYWDSTIEIIGNDNFVYLKYKCNEVEINVRDEYLFFALVNLRRELEAMSSKLLCNGSRIDVYPSGMSAIGTNAYVLINGKPAKKMVNIFEPASLDKIGTIEEQKAYRDNWIKSLNA
jgi:hypothetical protein